MALSDNHVNDVCMFGCGNNQCRFLDTSDMYNSNTFQCLKKSSAKAEINKSYQQFIKECKNRGVDPHSVNGAVLGDNCKGYLQLSTLVQGYDC